MFLSLLGKVSVHARYMGGVVVHLYRSVLLTTIRLEAVAPALPSPALSSAILLLKLPLSSWQAGQMVSIRYHHYSDPVSVVSWLSVDGRCGCAQHRTFFALRLPCPLS